MWPCLTEFRSWAILRPFSEEVSGSSAAASRVLMSAFLIFSLEPVILEVSIELFLGLVTELLLVELLPVESLPTAFATSLIPRPVIANARPRAKIPFFIILLSLLKYNLKYYVLL